MFLVVLPLLFSLSSMFINHRSHDHISEEYATQTLYHLRIKTRGSECMVPWKTWVSENYGRSRESRKHLWWFSSAISRFRVIFCVSRLGMFHQTERKGLGASFFFFKSLVFRFHGHNSSNWAKIEDHRRQCRATPWARGGVPPYISHIGMCRLKGLGYWAFLVWKRVYTLPTLVWNRVWFSRELRKRMNVFIVPSPNE